MQIIINVDVTDDCRCTTIESNEDTTNSITVAFSNTTGTSKTVEFYKCEDYVSELSLDQQNKVIIPDSYYSDGSILHIRLIEDDTEHAFIHIKGDASKYTDIDVKKITDYILEIDGIPIKENKVTLKNIADLIPAIATIDDCYINLLNARNDFVTNLNNKGIEMSETTTITDLVTAVNDISTENCKVLSQNSLCIRYDDPFITVSYELQTNTDDESVVMSQ